MPTYGRADGRQSIDDDGAPMKETRRQNTQKVWEAERMDWISKQHEGRAYEREREKERKRNDDLEIEIEQK